MPDATAPAPLVGRAAELAALAAAAGLGPPPRPGLALLSGDAGIGKSRLLAALAEQAVARGWRVAVGHCLDLGGSPLPYLPFSEIAARLQATRPEVLQHVLARWPAVARLLPTAGSPGPQEGAGPGEPVDRVAFFASLHAVLGELARTGPLLVVIEDLHWADRSTCDLLSYLFSRGFADPVSVVASYRSDDLHRRHPLRTVAAQWSRLPGMVRVELGPLPDTAVRELVQRLHPGPLHRRRARDGGRAGRGQRVLHRGAGRHRRLDRRAAATSRACCCSASTPSTPRPGRWSGRPRRADARSATTCSPPSPASPPSGSRPPSARPWS